MLTSASSIDIKGLNRLGTERKMLIDFWRPDYLQGRVGPGRAGSWSERFLIVTQSEILSLFLVAITKPNSLFRLLWNNFEIEEHIKDATLLTEKTNTFINLFEGWF